MDKEFLRKIIRNSINPNPYGDYLKEFREHIGADRFRELSNFPELCEGMLLDFILSKINESQTRNPEYDLEEYREFVKLNQELENWNIQIETEEWDDGYEHNAHVYWNGEEISMICLAGYEDYPLLAKTILTLVKKVKEEN